ncbi:MAG TPA: amidohydrolase family protein [Ilumatobacteraceae bacterium]|nr:amidohydrolase family protein [Ilumatobacteraceae bacterium]
MKHGYRIIDTDTHVGPNMETFEKYASPALRDRWSELLPYYMPVTEGHHLSIDPIPYKRAMNQSSDPERGSGAGSQGALSGKTTPLWTVRPQPEVNNLNVQGRLQDMEAEGVDIHVIIPATWSTAATVLDWTLARELYAAYHRYLDDYCSPDTDRLKATIMAPAMDPEWSAQQIRDLAGEPWVVAVTPVLPQGMPLDDPILDPIWEAMNETDLGILHHSFFYEPPYFPGYGDIWGNVVVARSAAHPWGAQRLLGYFLLSGLCDRYPNLRIGFAECSAGWLPGWLTRLEGQAHYLRTGLPEVKHTPLEYAQMGKVFVGVEPYEGAAMTKAIIDVCGEDVLMFQSDYPHGQCMFPNTPDVILGWEPVIGEQAMRKIMWDNAARYLRL